MLFGFALAVVAGNQLGLRTRSLLVLLTALWAIARVTYLFAPQSGLATLANIAFPAWLARHLAPRLLGSAKKWRNRALPVILLAICASAVVVALMAAGFAREPVVEPHRILRVAVALFALLLLFMGGRIIAPTVAGQLQRQGIAMPARVQPRIEGALIVLMIVATIALAWSPASDDFAWTGRVAGVAMIAAGALATVRLARWQLWALRGRSDLWCLAAGYAWLALGLVLLGVAECGLVRGARNEIAALHVVTIGSLGTLTLNVMAMSWLLAARRDPARSRLTVAGTLLIAAAAVLRVSGFFTAAALCWSAAYLLLLALFFRRTSSR
jgi:uncharacterized protein involved in response to NO